MNFKTPSRRWFLHFRNFKFTLPTALLFAGILAGCVAPVVGRSPQAGAPLEGRPTTPLLTGWQLQYATNVPESGEAISKVGYMPSKWLKATVPGTVLTSLVNDGVYPEPLWGENNRTNIIPESLCRQAYWYRNQFTVPAAYAGKKVWLNFDGINYMAEVWVNGHNAGMIKGAFARGNFDISPYVKAGETAAVAVRILPPPHPGVPLEQTAALGLGLNGGLLTQDGPTFICTVGWDWIPGIRDRDMGIWQKVGLTASGPVLVLDPLITTDLPLPRTDSADVAIQATLRNTTDAAQSGVLHGTFGDVSFAVPATIAAGATNVVNLTSKQFPQLHVLNPKLWWPNGFGEPNLYTLHLSFEVNGTVSDEQDINFGVRKITYDVPGSEFLTISVNGVPVYCKGGNWGMDEAMKRAPRERLEAQIRFHKEANYTMIRNWVGQSTSEDFYDLCDRYGILVWDEFFESGSEGPDPSGDTIPLYLANCREKVLRFRNHPCIALWCGRNEASPTPRSLADGLLAIMKELEPSRVYQANSSAGRGARSGGPYVWRPPQMYYTFQSTGNRAAVFQTELGSVSIPTIETIRAMMPAKDLTNYPNDDWAEHDLAFQGNNRENHPAAMNTRFGDKLGHFDLADFVRKAQMANYETFRAMYEGRFARLFKGSTAVLTWMSNPAQPSTRWQIYSYDLEPFGSFFGVKKACEPIHVQMNLTNFHVMVINHTTEVLPGLQARARVFNLDGSLKYDKTFSLTATNSAFTDLEAIEFPADVSAVHFVKLELRDAGGKLLSDNFYWRGTSVNDLTALDTLPMATLDANITRHDAGGKCLLDVTLSNPGKTIAVMAHLQLRKAGTNQRVLPVFYTDNYVSLLPGESKTVTIEAASKDLGNSRPLVTLDGWNVTMKGQAFAGADMAVNTSAQVGQ